MCIDWIRRCVFLIIILIFHFSGQSAQPTQVSSGDNNDDASSDCDTVCDENEEKSSFDEENLEFPSQEELDDGGFYSEPCEGDEGEEC